MYIYVDILLLDNVTSVYLFLKTSGTCTFTAMITVHLLSFCSLAPPFGEEEAITFFNYRGLLTQKSVNPVIFF